MKHICNAVDAGTTTSYEHGYQTGNQKKKKKERGGEGVESEDTENRYTILCSLHLIVLGKFSSGEQSLKDMLFIMSVVSSIQKNSICD